MSVKFSFDPNLLQWYDGMPLSCHHFQQSNLREQNINFYLLSKIAPYSWGIIQVEIDVPQMNSNLLILKHLECILPDYSIVFFPVYGEKPIEFELDLGIDGDLIIYCSLSEEPLVYETANQRYSSVLAEPVPDLNTGENKEAIAKLAPLIHISTKKINGLSIPIARLNCEVGQIKLLDYDPPSPIFDTCIYSKDLLNKSITELSTRMNNSYSKLKVKGEAIDFQEYGKIIMEQLWPLQTLLQTKNISPIEVYKQLVSLAVNIASIDEVTIPNFEIRYDHEDILGCFKNIIKFIDEKIKIIDSRYSSDLNRFSFDDGSYVKEVDLNCEKIQVMLHFKNEFEEWIENAIIVSRDRLLEAQMMRIIGCRRDIIDVTKKEVKKGETLNFVRLEILRERDYFSSSAMVISNLLEAENRPLGIYLLGETS